MNHRRKIRLNISAALAILALPVICHSVGYFPKTAEPYFLYDPADVTVEGTLLESPRYHDSDIVSLSGRLWMTWIEFIPDEGEQVWVGEREGEGWEHKARVTDSPGFYANPTLSVGAGGNVYLSYECEVEGQWDLFLIPLGDDLIPGATIRVTDEPTSDIRHIIVPDTSGGLWILWQRDDCGQFDIFASHFDGQQNSTPTRLSESPRCDWAPSAALLPDGDLVVVWDTFNGNDYDVVGKLFSDGEWQDGVFTLAGTPSFEVRTSVTANAEGRIWVTWEEGGKYWGHEYRPSIDRVKPVMGLHEERGPLHRYRRIHLAEFDPDNLTVSEVAPSLPTLAEPQALLRADGDSPPEPVGVYYERSVPVVDSLGRLWIVYRHFYAEGLATSVIHHVEEGWGVYARYLGEEGWSPLHRLFPDQGDMMQRLEAIPHGEGIAVTWTVGRTDRRPARAPFGVSLATIEGAGEAPRPVESRLPSKATVARAPEPRQTPVTLDLEGKTYHLYFGDLHRHTDLSLCRSPVDGSIDDAYRYAIDVAGHDFFGITDHSRDLAVGDDLSLLWRRCRNEVTRHQLCETFVPFFSYERSHSDTDHNVISLRDDMLRQHTYPLTKFWEECDDNTFTIPHQPFFGKMKLWNYNDNIRRPLLEIYQGCRNTTAETAAHVGLSRDYRFGFIASSDHLTTNSSFACVWARRPTRESIFRGLQSRRTYGATTKIEMRATAGDYWMGEEFTASKMPPIRIHADGTAPIKTMYVVVDGQTIQSHPVGSRSLDRTIEVDLSPGRHYVYIKLNQEDGNLAWASPFFVEIKAD